MSSGKRFKFNGSMIRVSTGTGTAKTITGISKTDPAVVSAEAHGFVLGTVGRISGVVGMTQVNGSNLYVVDNPEAGDFELAGVDSTGYTTYVSGGSFAPMVYSDFCELTGINQQDGTADEIDATTICSTAKEFETGLGDSGTLTIDYNFAPLTGVQAAMRAARVAGDQVSVEVQVGKDGAGGTVVMIGTVQQSSFTGGNGNLWTGSTTLRLTGEIFVLEAA